MLLIKAAGVAASALAATLALTSCSGTGSSGTGSSGATSTDPSSASGAVTPIPSLAAELPSDIKSSGVIRVAMDETYPPFESVSASGSVEGLDPDLANAIGQLLGVKVTFVNTPFDAIIPALAAKKVDMAMSSIGDTKARQAIVDFATYYWNGSLLLVKKGNPMSLASDATCGASVGVIRGSLQQNTFLPAQAAKCKKAGKPAPTVVAFQSGPQAQLALQSGRVDGVLEDAPAVANVAAEQPTLFQSVGPQVRNPNPGGVAFPQGSALAGPVREAINKLIKNGTYARILKKWNLSTIAIGRSQLNGALS
jgi:polar amino acid transport system substrate-binding protein